MKLQSLTHCRSAPLQRLEETDRRTRWDLSEARGVASRPGGRATWGFMALAIAQRYSTALAEALTEGGAGDPRHSLEQLRALQGALGESAELRSVFASPAIATADKHALATKIGERIGFTEAIRNFVFVLLDHNRIPILGDVIEPCSAWLDEREGLARIEVTSSSGLDGVKQSEIEGRFTKLLGKRVEASYLIDEKLLGGVVVRVGGTIYDGSMVSQLLELSRSMAGQV